MRVMGLLDAQRNGLADIMAPDGASPAESVVRQLADTAIDRWIAEPTESRLLAVEYWLDRLDQVMS